MTNAITIAVSKGRIFTEALPLLAAAGVVPVDAPDTSRKLILDTNRADVKLVLIRASDVPTYVEYGAADLGIAGKDVLLEYQGDGLYEPLDLEIACCRLMLAGPPDLPAGRARLRIATKYVNCTRRYYAEQGKQVEIIKLYGSLELAPLVGLADLIVVLVDTNRFVRMQARSIGELEIPAVRLHEALARLPAATRAALETAVARLRTYHQHQKQETWTYTEADGTVLGQQVTALDRVGLYVPGGKAAYPSSVLMNAVPAKVAGVAEEIMVVPTPGGELNELVLAAAALAGVDRVFAIGGAQAVAALAYGTASVPRVDKNVGPGNIYVATAKRRVYGTVGIDMIAGPSEILIVCDGKTDPDWTAMDLFSQAEHDEDAQSILLCPDAAYLDRVQASIEKLLPQMERAEIIRKSLEARGALIAVRDLDEAATVANFISPEHLELSVADPQALARWAARRPCSRAARGAPPTRVPPNTAWADATGGDDDERRERIDKTMGAARGAGSEGLPRAERGGLRETGRDGKSLFLARAARERMASSIARGEPQPLSRSRRRAVAGATP